MIETGTRRGHLDLLFEPVAFGNGGFIGDICASYIAFFAYLESLLACSLSSFLGVLAYTPLLWNVCNPHSHDKHASKRDLPSQAKDFEETWKQPTTNS
jgi:hypothetical protein